MAYPGNLHALVARSQHKACITSNEYGLGKESDDETPTENLTSNDRRRRSRRKPRTGLEADARDNLRIGPSAWAFRLGGNSSQVARGGRISSCDYGKLMDHGTFKPALLSPTSTVRARIDTSSTWYQYLYLFTLSIVKQFRETLNVHTWGPRKTRRSSAEPQFLVSSPASSVDLV